MRDNARVRYDMCMRVCVCVCAVLKKVSCVTQKIQNGQQFKGHVIWIIVVEALYAVQLIRDILEHPHWWCDVGHCVAVLENFVPPESVCIKRVA